MFLIKTKPVRKSNPSSQNVALKNVALSTPFMPTTLHSDGSGMVSSLGPVSVRLSRKKAGNPASCPAWVTAKIERGMNHQLYNQVRLESIFSALCNATPHVQSIPKNKSASKRKCTCYPRCNRLAASRRTEISLAAHCAAARLPMFSQLLSGRWFWESSTEVQSTTTTRAPDAKRVSVRPEPRWFTLTTSNPVHSMIERPQRLYKRGQLHIDPIRINAAADCILWR